MENVNLTVLHPVIEEALQAALYDLYSKVDSTNVSPIIELVPV